MRRAEAHGEFLRVFIILRSRQMIRIDEETTLPLAARVLETLPLDQLRPWPRNARVRQIVDSIRRFGFTNPVLIDDENRILAGHGRVEAARQLGMATAPCLRVGAEKRAYVLADNKLASTPVGTKSCSPWS